MLEYVAQVSSIARAGYHAVLVFPAPIRNMTAPAGGRQTGSYASPVPPAAA